MLVVARKLGEEIIIDLRAHGLGMISVKLIKVESLRQARIGVDADPSIPVDRKEIMLQKAAAYDAGRNIHPEGNPPR